MTETGTNQGETHASFMGVSLRADGAGDFADPQVQTLAAQEIRGQVDPMQRDTMVRTLKHLGLNASNYKVLKLLPLVYVASSTGAISPERERRVIELAHSHFHIGPDGERILQGWLDRRPDKAYFEEGLHDIVRLAYAPDEWEFDVDELRGLLAHAAAIARTSAAAMDEPTAPSSEDERALAEVARELGIVNGESWGELVRELGSTRAKPEGGP